MPRTEREIRTKVTGVSDPLVQKTLDDIVLGNQNIKEVKIVAAKTVVIQTETDEVTAGTLKDEYYDFLADLHSPQITAQITGGGYRLIDQHGRTRRDVMFTSLLSAYEKEMIAMNCWELRPLYRGMNICIKKS